MRPRQTASSRDGSRLARALPSSLAAILIATSPLFVALLAPRFDATERLNRQRLAGVAIGPAGVVALVGIHVGGRSNVLAGAACVLVVAFGYAVAPMVLKRQLADVDPRAPPRRGTRSSC